MGSMVLGEQPMCTLKTMAITTAANQEPGARRGIHPCTWNSIAAAPKQLMSSIKPKRGRQGAPLAELLSEDG
jgi:hypothetical protein